MSRVVVVCLDAFRHDYIRKTKFLREYARRFHMSRLETMFGYTVIPATAVSGRGLEEHGVWVQFIKAQGASPFRFARLFSPLEVTGLGGISRKLCTGIFVLKRIAQGKRYFAKMPDIPLRKAGEFDLSMEKAFCSPGSLPVKTIFDVLRERNIPFEAFDWPVRSNLNGSRVSIFEKNTDQHKFESFMKHSDSDARFFWLKLWELDTITHETGTTSRETADHVKRLDHYCEQIVERFSEKDPDTGFIFWSDHGMVDVKKTVDVMKLLEGLDVTMFLDSVFARFWVDRKAREKVMKRLDGSGLKLLSGSAKKRFGVYPDERKYGNLIYYCDPGTLIFPNSYNSASPDRAMHGYDPSFRDTYGILISSRKSPKRTRKMPELYKEMVSML